MSALDFFRGVGIILVIMIVAGGIAYVGDRVGHQVGRKRLTLFNIRPKYTSTIVAVGTGVVIAFVVTMVAILLNAQVKTAFFRLNEINARISELERQSASLEEKVNRGTLVVPADSLVVPYAAKLLPGQSRTQHMATLRNFYKTSIQYADETYAPFGIKPYHADDAAAENKIRETIDNKNIDLLLTENVPLLVSAIADKNLYTGDTMSITFNVTADTLLIPRGATLAQVRVPKGDPASLNLVVAQLQTLVSTNAIKVLKLPPFIANRVEVVQRFPDDTQIQAILNKGRGFLITAYAAQDVYPEYGGIPIDVVFSDAP